jgi:adenylate cyclase
MMREGRHLSNMREFGDQMCRRIVAAGIPIQRAFCSTKTLHPEVYGTAYLWRRDQPGAERLTAPHGFQRTDEMVSSPIVAVEKSGVMLRRRLCDANCPMDFPVLAEFKSAGGTDYLALPLKYSSGEINSITFATDRADGFTEAEVAGLADVAEALAIIVEVQSTRRIARHLMDTYVGHRTGERVLSGAITRGAAQTLRAVIWFCDLRGFTALADSLPRDRLIAMLNDYFEAMVAAVVSEGGEALKFMGDGLLAIFELGADEEPQQRCAAALRAANTASEKNRDAKYRAARGGRAGNSLRPRTAPGRSELRQYRRAEPARFHRHRSGGQSCGAPREDRLGAGASCGDLGELRGGGGDLIREPREASSKRRRGTAGSFRAHRMKSTA